LSALDSPVCRSCGTAVIGKFCHQCAEATHPHPPSASEFIHEFIGHYVALEGKLWRTLVLLVRRPGELTRQYLHGRRVPYLEPLRLYLTLSLVFFALAKTVGINLPQLTVANDEVGLEYVKTVTVRAGEKTREATATGKIVLTNDPGENQVTQGIAALTTALGSIKPAWRDNVAHFHSLPAAERSARLNHGFAANLPYMLIAALPLFALFLKLIYLRSGRRYGEHLVFALHVNAFAFLLASVMLVLPGTAAWVAMAMYLDDLRLVSVADYLQIIPLCWLLAYLPWAMQRVYGGSRRATAVRSLVLLAAHLAAVTLATMLAEAIAIVGHG
jgi:Protein of unknown function (DUF3667)